MTVKELIEILKKMDEDKEICISCQFYDDIIFKEKHIKTREGYISIG